MAESYLTLDLRGSSGKTRDHHHEYNQLLLPVGGKPWIQTVGRDASAI
jgi:hypothetical protein